MNFRKRIIQYEEETQILEDRQMKRVREIFPYDNPYDQQIESMKVILDALNKKQNLLFQSPTGTGKSLMVMCTAAAFAEKENSQYQILFLTRTNGQVNGLVKELNKIRNIDSFISKYSILAGRNNLCIKKDQFRQYVIDNKIDPNGKNLYKKYEMFCTDCKKCLIKSSAKKDLDNENILNVSKPIVIGQTQNTQQQQQIKKKEQILSATAEDLNSNEIEQQEGKYIPQKELACLHFGLNEMLKEKEYKFEGYSKVKHINTQQTTNTTSNQSFFHSNHQSTKPVSSEFNFKNHLNLIEMFEKLEEQEQNTESSNEINEEEEESKQEMTNNNNNNNNNNNKTNKNINKDEGNDFNKEYDERLPDIEDMVKIFKEKQGQCPFYFNRYIAKQSNIVFMNYNYLLNPDILTYVSANIIDRSKKQIIIFDEAHNIEQQAESQFQTKLKMRNLQKSHDLVTNVLTILRLAKQLRILDVVKQKGLELIDKIKESNKSKAPEQNDREKLDNLNNNEIQLKSEQIENEDEFIPQCLNIPLQQEINSNIIHFEDNQIQIEKDEILLTKQEEQNNSVITNIPLNCLREKNTNIFNECCSYQQNNIINKLSSPIKLEQQNEERKANTENYLQNYQNNIKKYDFKIEDEDEDEDDDIEFKLLSDLKKNLLFVQNNCLSQSKEVDKVNEMDIQLEDELIEIIKKENIVRETIKIEEDDEMNEIAVDIHQQNERDNQGAAEDQNEDKYEKQKRILEEFMDNYEERLPRMQSYLNKLINFCLNRSQKSQKAESNLLSEYHFVSKYYALFGLLNPNENNSNKENQPKEENEGQKTILQEAIEVLEQKNIPNKDYLNNLDLFDSFSEFSYIFHQTMRYVKVKYSRECQQKAIEDILGSAVYYEGNLHQLKVSMRYFANNLQPLNHLSKIKKIVIFLRSLKDFHDLSVLQQRFKKRDSFKNIKSNLSKFQKQSNNHCAYSEDEYSLQSPDLQKLQDFYFAIQKNESKNDLLFTIGCLSGKYAFREIFSRLNVHSLILSSGTLEPFDILIKNLDVKFQIYSGKHVINAEKQVFSQFIKESNNNGTPLNFSFEKMYMDDIEIREQKKQNITSSLHVMQNIVTALLEQNIKGGVLVFFKSYELMSNFYQSFLGSDVQKALKDIPLFYEKSTNPQFQADFTQFKRYVQVLKKTSIFFAACRGKLAEGIDLNDDLARCVILVGVPLWNISDPYFICKKKYVELVLKMDSNEWSRKQVIKCVNQAAGRSIRHRSDWGSVFFICELFDQTFHPKNYKKYISKWILLGENYQKDYINAYKQFLKTNSMKVAIK